MIDPPNKKGWWDDFVANAFDVIEGPNPGAFQGAQSAVTNYGHKVAADFRREFIDPLKTPKGRMQWLVDNTAPGPEGLGTMLGAVGRKGGAKAATKALEKLRSAAVRAEDGTIYTGSAHPMAFMDGEDAGARFTGHVDDEGFIHPTLGYITRRQAKEMGYFGKAEKDVSQTVQVKSEGPSKLIDALDQNEGFTYDPFSDDFVTGGGVMVGGVPGQKRWVGTREELTPDLMEKFQADNAKLLREEGMFVGGWLDRKTGKIHLDVSQRVPREQAEKMGRERGELAGFDLDKMEEMRWDEAPKASTVIRTGTGHELMVGSDGKPVRAVRGPDGRIVDNRANPKSTHAPMFEKAGWNPITNEGFDKSHGYLLANGEFVQTGDLGPIGSWTDPKAPKVEAPAVHTREGWTPNRRGVFDFSPEGGVPATEYREPAPLPFESAARPKAGPSELAQKIAGSKKVEKRIVSDLEKGLDLGGRGWYGTLPLRRYFESLGKPEDFADFNNAGGAGSIRTPTHNELTNLSLLRYAKKRGLPYEEARQEFFRRFPGTMKPTFMGIHGKVYDRALAAGKMVPSKPDAGELKVPHYTHDRNLGAEGVALDTHELRAMSQALGVDEGLVKTAAVDAESYNLMTAPYRRVAKRMGLHPDQVQAGRWIGGGKQTGLKSQPKGDFMQTLEDGLLFTARSRGLDESPKGLRSLWDRIAAGDDFFMPFGGEGGFPVGP